MLLITKEPSVFGIVKPRTSLLQYQYNYAFKASLDKRTWIWTPTKAHRNIILSINNHHHHHDEIHGYRNIHLLACWV